MDEYLDNDYNIFFTKKNYLVLQCKIIDMKIIGIETRTTNQNGQAMQDIGGLWNRFFSENIISKIPNAVNSNVYAIYTDYESDYTGEYTTLLGLEVSSLDEIPNGLVGREFPKQNFKRFLAKGAMPQAVAEAWQKIWEQDKELNRLYQYDYELYTEKSQQSDLSEVEIFIGVKDSNI